MENNEKNIHVSVSELAKMLGISRVAVFKRIQKGQIPAKKVGRAYVISLSDLEYMASGTETPEEKRAEAKAAVERVVKEYGETLKLLGKE